MRRACLLAFTIAVGVVLAGCSASTPSTPTGPNLARPGPYAVGVTTLDLGAAGKFGERLATVFYPADASKVAGHAVFSYRLADPLPHALLAIIPAKYNATVTVDAHVGVPGSPHGPFPIVLFSHGFGASRLYYSHVLTGIASWGFVVVSADYLERGLLAEATQRNVTDTPAQDLRTMFSSLTATETASAQRFSPLYGVANPHKVAAVGHSAGGQTAFDALDDRRVTMAVGWAPVGPSGPPSHKPVMIIGEDQDIALTKATLTGEFHKFPGPTTFVEISGEGHNSYTDICTSIRQGNGGLIGFAISLHLVSQELAKLAVNGCTAQNIPPERFWPIVQYYTVAALRNGLGIGATPIPGRATPGQFPGFTITFHQHS